MKKILLSLTVLCTSLFSYSQSTTQFPCVRSYQNSNLGGGDCKTLKSGSVKYYPGYLNQSSDMAFFPTGKFIITFKSPIPAGVPAPAILKAGIDDGTGHITAPQFQYKYAAYHDDPSVPRTTVIYCYYGSASNQNIFNGSNAPLLAFEILYPANAGTSTCGGVTETEESPTPLPVNFKSFTASKSGSTNGLRWTTSTEINNKGFYVQRFYNGQWENLGFVATKADGGNSTSDLNYVFNDVFNFKGVVQYRILQVDIDGKAKYSQVRSLSNEGNGAASSILIYPNPASAHGNVSLVLSDASAFYDLQIIDNSGRIVKEFNAVRSTQQVSGLPKGQYLARAKERESGQVSVEKFIVQ